jgi:endonuclease/exonuclease/phosphatase family metal-dependent hydrolase
MPKWNDADKNAQPESDFAIRALVLRAWFALRRQLMRAVLIYAVPAAGITRSEYKFTRFHISQQRIFPKNRFFVQALHKLVYVRLPWAVRHTARHDFVGGTQQQASAPVHLNPCWAPFMKIANWNIEWMNRWFSPDSETAALRPADQVRGVTDLEALCGRVARVIDALAADVLTIQEGPSRRAELQLFVDRFLDGRYDILGPSGSGQQKLYALIRKGGRAVAAARAEADGEVRFDVPFPVDIDGDLHLARYELTREPLLFDVTDAASGKPVRIVNLHLKSKYVHMGEQLWRDPATRIDFVRAALEARRRISAEAMRVRAYLDELLAEDGKRRIVVCGDLNDGPGSDYFEQHYLTHNLAAAALAGNPFRPQQMFRHGFIDRVDKADNYTAVLDDFIDEVNDRRILLDHILLSPGLYWSLADGTVEHAVFEAQIDPAAAPGSRQHLPSDHRPQSVTF